MEVMLEGKGVVAAAEGIVGGNEGESGGEGGGGDTVFTIVMDVDGRGGGLKKEPKLNNRIHS